MQAKRNKLSDAFFQTACAVTEQGNLEDESFLCCKMGFMKEFYYNFCCSQETNATEDDFEECNSLSCTYQII